MKRFIWNELSKTGKTEVLSRPSLVNSSDVASLVRDIIRQIKTEGDQALIRLSREHDHFKDSQLAVGQDQQRQILESLKPERKSAIDMAYKNIFKFHEAQKPIDIVLETIPGTICELKSKAIKNIGLYIPGGSAPLPSTVLMLGVPAQLAGCSRIVLMTPPNLKESSRVAPEIIYAANLCGIQEIYTVGGAQAIAALAYGTSSIAKVDKIFGPGNRYVTEAKQQVSLDPYGAMIDMPAGPSEVLVIADAFANPAFIAADLLSQAEHGPDSQVLLVSDSQSLLDKVDLELTNQLINLPRRIIAQEALANSRSILTRDLETSIQVTNTYAPEHLIIQTQNASHLIDYFDSSASIFVGPWSPESAGDYASGTNHVLPTYGYSKSVSSLSLIDFYRRYTVQTSSQDGIRRLGPSIITLAEAEGLEAHANAVRLRLAWEGENEA